MSDLSEDQKEALVKFYGKSLAEAIQQVLEGEKIVTLYGPRETSSEELGLQVRLINELIEELRLALDNITADISMIDEQSKEFKNRIHSLENVVEPDKTDVHNINRRIEMLAQRIAKLESKKRGWKKGGLVEKKGGKDEWDDHS